MNKIESPLVSVVMATFNEPEAIIREAINSILVQSLKDFELIIIDDSTNPETLQVIEELAKDPRVVLVRDSERIGLVRALNWGLKLAKGKYIARMDGDDCSVKDRLQLQVSFLEKNLKYSVVGGQMSIINECGEIISNRSYPKSSLKLTFWTMFRSPVSHPTIMMRREIVDKGYFYNENFSKSEDLEYWLRLLRNGYKFYNLSDIVLKFRVCEGFGNKRSNDHWENNYNARLINFSWKFPVRSIISLIIAKSYTLMPSFIIKQFYSFENKNK